MLIFMTPLVAALRLIATGLGIVREPSYVVVRVCVRPEGSARDRTEHAG
jgi:hypothetical protein